MKLKELMPFIADCKAELRMKHRMGHISKCIVSETTVYLDDNDYREMCLRFAGEMEVVSIAGYDYTLSIELADEVEA